MAEGRGASPLGENLPDPTPTVHKTHCVIQCSSRAIPANPTDPQRQKIRKALEDNLETSRTRLANFQKAQDNYELMKVEIDRLEDKIRSLSEVAVNRQEPEFISGQVDQVSSMAQTEERTMGELQFLTGLEAATEDVSQLLQRETVMLPPA